ncbi:MAG: hypothetical protein C5B50_09905 [Verrucomicrobia bacterium]|nr:MAG: hypothetical protein C5B50_09905 [Verrucomicrobiota bacterium]
MKIAFVTTDNRDQVRNYSAPDPIFGPAPSSLLQGFAMLPEAEVHVITCTRQPVRAPDKVGPNLFFHSLQVPRIGWMRTFFQGCIRAVRRKLQEIQPAIAHGQGTEGHYSLSAVFSGYPNVCTIHGIMRLITRVEKTPMFSYNWLAARLETLALRRTDGVICLSRHTQRAIADATRRTWVLPNAVDASFLEVDAALNGAATPRVLCVGRVCPLKNQNALIASLDPLARKRNFQLQFLGIASRDEPYGAEFFRLIDERSWCAYGGQASHEELRGHLRNASLLVLASLEENCPMVVLEAMAAGVPVVAGRIGGVPDLIEEGSTGLFFDPQNKASIADAVERALADSAAAAKMAKLAKARALERFHPKVVAQRHLEIYQEVIGGG